MGNSWHIPKEVETRLRKKFTVCAYCGRQMKLHLGVKGSPGDKATFEHLNRNGPFYWSDGLQEKDVVITCAQCNASRGRKTLVDWFKSLYCLQRGISQETVAPEVRDYLRTAESSR